jgi:hypothetical protein
VRTGVLGGNASRADAEDAGVGQGGGGAIAGHRFLLSTRGVH